MVLHIEPRFLITPDLAPTHSNNQLIVILLGIACGFIIISGVTPFWVNGISSCLKIIPQVPF